MFEVVSGAVRGVSGAARRCRGSTSTWWRRSGVAAGEDPVETDPQVEVKWSRDGGYRYGVPVWRAIGREGEGARTVSVNRLGLSGPKGIRFQLRVTDPVPVTLFGAELTLIEKRA